MTEVVHLTDGTIHADIKKTRIVQDIDAQNALMDPSKHIARMIRFEVKADVTVPPSINLLRTVQLARDFLRKQKVGDYWCVDESYLDELTGHVRVRLTRVNQNTNFDQQADDIVQAFAGLAKAGTEAGKAFTAMGDAIGTIAASSSVALKEFASALPPLSKEDLDDAAPLDLGGTLPLPKSDPGQPILIHGETAAAPMDGVRTVPEAPRGTLYFTRDGRLYTNIGDMFYPRWTLVASPRGGTPAADAEPAPLTVKRAMAIDTDEIPPDFGSPAGSRR